MAADVQADFTTLAYEGVDEILLSHVLEHFSWRRTDEILDLLFGWLKRTGVLTVEVPDIALLLKMDPGHPYFNLAIYGDQSTEGEYHKSSFTVESLITHLTGVGFLVQSARTFLSEEPQRTDYPCIEVVAIK